MGNCGFQADDDLCKIDLRNRDNEREETFPVHISDISCVCEPFLVVKGEVAVYMFPSEK